MKIRPDIRLYGILDADRLAGRDLPALARASVEGGVTILQLRDKTGSAARVAQSARAILAAIAGKVPLLINDRVDIAREVGAAGAHIGQEDLAPQTARAILGPDAILGITVKNRDHLRTLDPALVDYGCIGGVFETLSKVNPDAPVGLDGLARLRAGAHASGLPVGAIAGINASNAAACIGAGADGCAMISALYLVPDVAAAARNLRHIIDGALANRGVAA